MCNCFKVGGGAHIQILCFLRGNSSLFERSVYYDYDTAFKLEHFGNVQILNMFEFERRVVITMRVFTVQDTLFMYALPSDIVLL